MFVRLGRGVGGWLQCIEPLAGQRPIGRKRSDIEVNVAARCVRVAPRDQPLNQGDHLGHVSGSAWLDVGWQAAERGICL
jgi:hypothetical protein